MEDGMYGTWNVGCQLGTVFDRLGGRRRMVIVDIELRYIIIKCFFTNLVPYFKVHDNLFYFDIF